MELKHCSRCGETKPLEDFSKDRTTKDGLSARCRTCRKAYLKDWYYSLGKEARQKSGYSRQPHKVAWRAAYYQRNKDRQREYGRKWIAENLDKHRTSVREAMRRKRSTAKGRLENNVSRALNRALRGKKNGEPSFALLGFAVEELMTHLERQFQRGMTWENYGKWHVDHIRPLASFTYSDPSDPDFKRAWALTNLRPLWATENISKGARVSLLI